METIAIRPEGPIQFGIGMHDDGAKYVEVELTDADGARAVVLTLELPAFVALADHLRMVADELLAEQGQ